MKIVFMGSSDVSVPTLKSLAEHRKADIEAIVTHPDKPKGRGLKLMPTPVKVVAKELGLHVIETDKVSDKSVCDYLESIEPDLFVVVSFGEILSDNVLSIPKKGSMNLHFSLLPKYRGAAPVTHAIIEGEEETGCTVFWINERMDSGDIILQKEDPIFDDDTRASAEERLSYIGADLSVEAVNLISQDKAPRIKQNEEEVTYAPKLNKSMGLIDWKLPAKRIHNMIRGLFPWPGCYTFYKGKRLYIYSSSVEPGGQIETGMIVKVTDGIYVGTGKGILKLKELKLEGKRRMKVKEFLNGHKVSEGEKFRSQVS